MWNILQKILLVTCLLTTGCVGKYAYQEPEKFTMITGPKSQATFWLGWRSIEYDADYRMASMVITVKDENNAALPLLANATFAPKEGQAFSWVLVEKDEKGRWDMKKVSFNRLYRNNHNQEVLVVYPDFKFVRPDYDIDISTACISLKTLDKALAKTVFGIDSGVQREKYSLCNSAFASVGPAGLKMDHQKIFEVMKEVRFYPRFMTFNANKKEEAKKDADVAATLAEKKEVAENAPYALHELEKLEKE